MQGRRRFFNTALRGPVYQRCLLPVTGGAGGTQNVLPANTFTRTMRATYGYHQELYTPPNNAVIQGGPSLSAPFARYFDAPPPAPKKRKLFQRKTPVEGHLRTVAVRMWPNKVQREELRRCFSMARRAYNYACYIVRQEQSADLSDLRSMWANHPVPEWASSPETRVSKQIQNRAIQDVVNAFNSNEAKQKKNPQNARPYTLHFRSLKCTPTEIVHIEKDYKGKACMLRFEPAPGGLETKRNRAECVAIMGSNFKHVGGIKLQDDPRIIARLLAEGEHLKEEAKIKWDKRLNSYHLLYTYEIPRLADPDPTFQTKRIVACDPGCYPFQAWYAPCSGEHGALLVGGTEELMRRCYDIDHRCSSIAKNTSRGKLNRRRRRRMRKRLKRERSRLRGWVKDAHYDAAHTILQQNTLILQPRLAVQELVVTATRNISDRTARAMLTWSHSMFIDRLRSASSRYDGCHVMEITEPGTSKTCTNCGAWKQNLLPRDKIYSCTRCGLSFDRQMAGARNNFLAAYGAAVGMGWDGTE